MGAEDVRTSPGAFFDDVATLMLRGDPRLTPLGPHRLADDHFRRRAEQVRHSVWNMQNRMSLRALRRGAAVAAGLEHDAVTHRDLYAPLCVDSCPLVTTAVPAMRVGPVPGPMLLTDGSHVFLSGPEGTRVSGSVWASQDPVILAAATAVFEECWRAARPWQEATDRPVLERRTYEVALRLADGAGDREIAAELGISRRTVSAEVRTVIDWLQARGRGHAIALLVGVGR
ncbi:helix-turn-helix transcriptional regulator [Phycicoccus endophyticus]|uniref:Helix-turn-helix transcriptional regulator n=1 Tax=Phycicoccus endophyticus TaxID=1690220 RepID=A0A7G9R3W0_9MICO|nr:helix-turn-helix transcriptional regulator [Phycicoccus endophyticus]NHI18116.1 helix-turn-helix transcriptional regulator [Phycicoccus endophyticus]QNN50285.1 helix-turn-helix transcriptional regulator [Phycicoccus endophyticus]GGL26283.1 hypothetical protein GCM10012283_05630 [Phycicoccus endophyticus]